MATNDSNDGASLRKHRKLQSTRIARPSYKDSQFVSPKDWDLWLVTPAYVEDGVELMNRDLLNEELSKLSPMLRAYIAHLEMNKR